MKKLVVAQVAGSILAGVFSMAALAQQDPNLGNSPPAGMSIFPADPAAGSLMPGSGPPSDLRGSGVRRSVTWISAVKFTGLLVAGAPPLTYTSWQKYNSPGAASPRGYFAQLDLEPGVSVDMLTCVVDDTSASNNVSVELQKYTTDVHAGGTSTSYSLGSASTTGTAGSQYIQFGVVPPETISTFDGAWLLTQYHIRANIASDTALAGCWAWWTRQVTPAPASASFTDVPTGSWAFRWIEALKASGITSGCTATTFCPNNNITRAEVAVMLSKALGLSWPN
jgi:hypothetical protein